MALLRTAGHDVRYVAEDSAGISDQRVVDRLIAEDRILVTDDKDFGELVARRGHALPGVLLTRIDPADSRTRLARVAGLIGQFGWRLPGHCTVLDRHKVRFRNIPVR